MSSPPLTYRRTLLALAGAAVLAFALGPRASVEPRWIEPALPETLAALEARLAEDEGGVPGLRPGDAKGIVWADPERPSVTPLALVYLHGFSADRHEVEPLISELADALGANVFFTRLSGHGRDGAAMTEVAPEDWLDDTAEALARAVLPLRQLADGRLAEAKVDGLVVHVERKQHGYARIPRP